MPRNAFHLSWTLVDDFLGNHERLQYYGVQLNNKLKYDYTKDGDFSWYPSENGEDAHGKPFSVHFGTGEINGYLAHSSVYFGDSESGILLPNQDFGNIDEETGGVFLSGYFSGVLGLAYRAMAIYDHNPVIDRIFEKNMFNGFKMFSFYMSKEAGKSRFVLGEPDKSLYTGDISWVPVTKNITGKRCSIVCT